MSSYVTCTACDKSCKTCSGSLSTQCLSCEQGFSISNVAGGSCSAGAALALRDHYYPSGAGSSQFTIPSPITTVWTYCGPHYLLFGYRQTQAGKNIRYISDLISTRNYYGFSVKMRVMFIDKWPVTGAITIHHQTLSSQPVYTWTYDTFGSLGEQGCGGNDVDYLITIYAEHKYEPTSNYITFYISSNADLFSPYPNWGVKDIIVTALKCDSACTTCKGPLATDCIACAVANRVVVNKTCTCNTATFHYDQSGLCTTTCNAGSYKDTITAKCVVPLSCTPPKRFADPSTGFCVQDCPANRYAQSSSQICVTNCVCATSCGAAAYNEYKYDGAASRSC